MDSSTGVEVSLLPKTPKFSQVPGGWWHAVLNLDDSVGVTQNYCSRENFRTVWDKTRSGRKSMARCWLEKLRKHEDPALRGLAEIADRQPPVPRVTS